MTNEKDHIAVKTGLRHVVFISAGVFLSVLGTRLFVASHFVTSVPFWDQWDAEGWNLFKPFLEHCLTWHQMIAPHNEHRIIVTRLISLLIFELSGHLWRPKLEMYFNAGVAATTAVLVVIALARFVPSRYKRLAAIVPTLLWMSPASWENILCGFQSQMYFLVLLSIVTLWTLPNARPFSFIWFIVTGLAAINVFTMASGFFAALAILILITSTSLRNTRIAIKWPTVAVSTLIVAIGLLAFSPTAGDDYYKARTLWEFLKSLSYDLSWPAVRIPFGWILLYYPAWRLFRSEVRPRLSGARRSLMCILLWSALQSVALAYCRGRGGHMPPSRYIDVLGIGAIGNCAILLIFNTLFTPRLKRIWLVVIGGALAWESGRALRILPDWTQNSISQIAKCRLYLNTSNLAALDGGGRPFAIPYPDQARLAHYLDDPTIRSILTVNDPPNMIENIASMLSLPIAVIGVGLLGLVLLKSERTILMEDGDWMSDEKLSYKVSSGGDMPTLAPLPKDA